MTIAQEKSEGRATGDECPQRDQWITLDEAIESGLRLDYVMDAIGPRRVGTVYLCGYWRTINTVTSVMVRVGKIERNGRLIPAVVGWQITEHNVEDAIDRNHMTSWEYGHGNAVLCGPGDIRPRRERGRK